MFALGSNPNFYKIGQKIVKTLDGMYLHIQRI